MASIIPAETRRRRILVVDDNAAVLETIVQGLSALGYQIETAADGEEAYKKFVASPPDALICDIMMPELDGLNLCKLLRSKDFNGPIILLTVIDDIKTMGEGLVIAGADSYVVKPCDSATLHQHLQTLFSAKAA